MFKKLLHSLFAGLTFMAAVAAVPAHAQEADRLAMAITRVVEDRELAGRLAVTGQDRARAYSWRDSAERVWLLHADL